MIHDGFGAFFQERFSRTVVLLITMGASRADAEDATQTAMTQAWKNWDAIHEPAAWVRTVAVRTFWKQARTRQHEVALDGSVPDPIAGLDHGVFTEEQELVLRLLRGLPPGQRTVAALYYDGLTCDEMAALLAKPPATVRSQLRHARQALKEMMLSERTLPQLSLRLDMRHELP